MTDSQYNKLLAKTAFALREGMGLLREAELEYERRYDINPSDTVDDNWIDAMTGSSGDPHGLNSREVDSGAVLSGCKSYYGK